MSGLNEKTRSKVRRFVCLWAMLFTACVASGQTGREYDLKAAFLFNFAQFVEWPPSASPPADEPFVIGVLGQDPFGAILDEIVRNETVQGRPIVVQRFRSVDGVGRCQILFISASEDARAREILAALAGRGLLTVGESEPVAAAGGVIRFLVVNNKLRLRINVEAASREQLKISSKLLRLAEVVGQGRSSR